MTNLEQAKGIFGNQYFDSHMPIIDLNINQNNNSATNWHMKWKENHSDHISQLRVVFGPCVSAGYKPAKSMCFKPKRMDQSWR